MVVAAAAVVVVEVVEEALIGAVIEVDVEGVAWIGAVEVVVDVEVDAEDPVVVDHSVKEIGNAPRVVTRTSDGDRTVTDVQKPRKEVMVDPTWVAA